MDLFQRAPLLARLGLQINMHWSRQCPQPRHQAQNDGDVHARWVKDGKPDRWECAVPDS